MSNLPIKLTPRNMEKDPRKILRSVFQFRKVQFLTKYEQMVLKRLFFIFFCSINMLFSPCTAETGFSLFENSVDIDIDQMASEEAI